MMTNRRYMLLTFGVVLTSQSQTISFNHQFTTPGIDRATAVAADASGIYVIGNRPSSQGGPGRGGVRKYDPLGNELWTQEFSAPTPDGIWPIGAAVDAAGVYVLGIVGNDAQLILRKYSSGGTGLMQVNVLIPNGVKPGGYVPVVLEVGTRPPRRIRCGPPCRNDDQELIS